MKVYLAGPMRGIPNFNFPAFHEAAAKYICEEADAIAVLPYSHRSKGASAELAVARALGLAEIWL